MLFTFAPLSLAQKTKPQYTYCVDPEWLPIEAIENGKHVGMSNDYLNYMVHHLGWEMTLVPTKTWNQTMEYLRTGVCQMSPMLNQTEERSEFLSFSDSFFKSPYVLVGLESDDFVQGLEPLFNKKLAAANGFLMIDYIKTNYPKIKIILNNSQAQKPFNIDGVTHASITLYDTEMEALSAVIDGHADAFVGSMFSTNYLLRQHQMDELKVIGWAGPEDVLRFGVSKELAHLIPEINQALASIDDRHHKALYHKWSNVTVIDNTNYPLIKNLLLLGGAGAAIMLIYMYLVKRYNRQLKSQNEELNRLKKALIESNEKFKKLSTQDLLTGLYNRYYFDLALKDETCRYQEDNPISLILIDIDHFKSINDRYGHAMGDLVLRQFASMLKEQIPEMDLLSRWGGEEFAIFSNNTTAREAQSLCIDIQKALCLCDFHSELKVTASFGVAQLGPHETMSECFHRADQALYQAKSTGRNKVCISGSVQDISERQSG